MKALEKDRTRRYETANAFAADVQRYLNDEPVQACPPSATYRFRKFARRNRVAITTATLVAAALVLGTIVSTWQAIRANAARPKPNSEQIAEAARGAEVEQRRIAEDQRTDAQRQRDQTLRNLYLANIKLAHQDWNVGHLSRMTTTLDALRPGKDSRDLRGWEWYYLASCLANKRTSFTAARHNQRMSDGIPQAGLLHCRKPWRKDLRTDFAASGPFSSGSCDVRHGVRTAHAWPPYCTAQQKMQSSLEHANWQELLHCLEAMGQFTRLLGDQTATPWHGPAEEVQSFLHME